MKETLINDIEMAGFVDEKLLGSFEEAANSCKGLSISHVEITLAAFLGMSVGESCDTEEHMETNLEAYYAFIKNLARYSRRKKMEVN